MVREIPRCLFASARARPVGCLAPLGCYATGFCNCLSTNHNGRDRTPGDPQSYFNENLVWLRLRRTEDVAPTDGGECLTSVGVTRDKLFSFFTVILPREICI